MITISWYKEIRLINFKQMNPKILDWLSETLNRIFMKQPKYFKYWTWLSFFAMAISGIPYILVQFNVTLPEPFATLSNKAVTGGAIVMLLMSKLTVKSPVIAQTEQGQAITTLNTDKMPFTAKTEAKDVAGVVSQIPIISEPDLSKIKPSAPGDKEIQNK